jgi:hypothetical protein
MARSEGASSKLAVLYLLALMDRVMALRSVRVKIRATASRPTRRNDPTSATYSVLPRGGGRGYQFDGLVIYRAKISYRLSRPRNGTGILTGVEGKLYSPRRDWTNPRNWRIKSLRRRNAFYFASSPLSVKKFQRVWDLDKSGRRRLEMVGV